MLLPLRQSHPEGCTSKSNENKSKEHLTNLLYEQIEQNQILINENAGLEKQQIKLVELLEIKSKEIKQLKSVLHDKGIPYLEKKYYGKNGNPPSRQMGGKNQNISVGKEEKLAQTTNLNKSQLENLSNPNRGLEISLTTDQKYQHNESTTIYSNYNNTTSVNNSQPTIVQTLKSSIKEKEDEMVRMREYYTKAIAKTEEKCQREYKGEIEQYRQVIGKQKQRIKQLMAEVQKLQEQKSQWESQRQHYEQNTPKKQTDSQQSSQLQSLINQLEHKLATIQQQHQIQLTAIEQAQQQQKQKLMHQHEAHLQQIQQNTIYKIQQVQQSKQKLKQQFETKLSNKNKQMNQLNAESYQLQNKLKESMMKYEEQCEIVIAIETNKQQLSRKISELQKQISLNQCNSTNNINIDNIHKQYHITLEEKEMQLQEKEEQVEIGRREVESSNKILGKYKEKYEEHVKKTNEHVYALELSVNKYREEVQVKEEEYQYLVRENKLKEEENRRLINKINKETERKQQYIVKLQEKISQMKEELNQWELSVQQKQNEVGKYREEMGNFVNKLKEELSKRQKQLTNAMKQMEVSKKQANQMQQKYATIITNIQIQNDETKKKYLTICDRLRLLQSEKQNYRSLYDETLKQLKQTKERELRFRNENEELQIKIQEFTKQIQYFKEEILINNLNENEKEQLQKLKNELYEHKMRVNKSNENNNKLKEENSKILKENLTLEESISYLKGQTTKYHNELEMKKQTIADQQQKIKQLEGNLKQRCKELETSMPYLNKVLQEKKNNELQLEKRNNQIKKLTNIIELTKKSKAEEIVNLNREVQISHNKLSQLENQMKDDKQVIERFNKDKVNMLRENTTREDHLKKLQRENKQLKDDLKQSQKNVEKLMEYLGVAEAAMECVDLEQPYTKKGPKR